MLSHLFHVIAHIENYNNCVLEGQTKVPKAGGDDPVPPRITFWGNVQPVCAHTDEDTSKSPVLASSTFTGQETEEDLAVGWEGITGSKRDQLPGASLSQGRKQPKKAGESATCSRKVGRGRQGPGPD